MTMEERFNRLVREHTRTQTMLVIMMTMLAWDHDHSTWFRYLMAALMFIAVGIDVAAALYKFARYLMSFRIRRTS